MSASRFKATSCLSFSLVSAAILAPPVLAYPPAVGIIGPSRDCLACHADNGPWKDEKGIVIDIIDKVSGKSLKQEDGSFLIAARRGEADAIPMIVRPDGTNNGAWFKYGHLWLQNEDTGYDVVLDGRPGRIPIDAWSYASLLKGDATPPARPR